MTTNFRALCAELINELNGYKVANPMHDRFLLNRARAALVAEPVPPVDGEVADPVIPGEYRGFNAVAYRNGFHAGYKHALTRAALAAVPVPPADGEVAELVNHLLKVAAEDESDGCTYDSAFTRRAAELLERLAPQPVPEGPSDEELWRIGDPEFQSNTWPTDAVRRAVLARWRQPVPQPVPQPELEELTNQEIEEWAAASSVPGEFLDPDSGRWQRCFTSEEFYATVRAVLDEWGQP